MLYLECDLAFTQTQINSRQTCKRPVTDKWPAIKMLYIQFAVAVCPTEST